MLSRLPSPAKPPPAATTAALPPTTTTTHPTDLEIGLSSSDKDEEMKEAVEVDLSSGNMTLPFREKESV